MSLQSYMQRTSPQTEELVEVGERGDIVSFAEQYLEYLDNKRTNISGKYRQLRYYVNIFLVHGELDLIARILPDIEKAGSRGASWLTGRYAGVNKARTYLNGCRRARYPSVAKEYNETGYLSDYLTEIEGIRDYLKESRFLGKLTDGETEQQPARSEDNVHFANTSHTSEAYSHHHVKTGYAASSHCRDGYTTSPAFAPSSSRPSQPSPGGDASFPVYDNDGIPTGQNFYRSNVQESPRIVEVKPRHTTYASNGTGRHSRGRGRSREERRNTVAGILLYMS